MDARRALARFTSRGATAPRVIVKDYGRDSLLVWANLLLAPLFTLLGLRVGLQSEERVSARIQSDTAVMRKKGYLVSSVQTFSLPGIVAPEAAAHWYRVTFELAATQSRDEAEGHPAA
jgi:hypothetical protein